MSSAASDSAWSPLKRTVFRSLWTASLVSNIGVWMQNVGAGWYMTSLTDASLPVALLQAATSLPVLLVGLPSGAIADIIDRRRLLIVSQTWMLLSALGLTVATATGLDSEWALLLFTFALGLGAAVTRPAWQAIIPEVVPRAELPSAAALNGININIARVIGPAIAGLLLAAQGVETVFLINAVSFIGVIVVLVRWKRKPIENSTPPEHVMSAMWAGIHYLQHAPSLQNVIIRSGVVVSCASALWALMPVVARQTLGFGATGYSALLACLGAGAVAGAVFLPNIRRRLSFDGLIIAATLLMAAVIALFASLQSFWALCGIMAMGGVAWVTVLSGLNASVQMIVPRWVQARALAMYQMVFQGSMALGSIVWGSLADRIGISNAMYCAAGGLVIGLLSTFRYPLESGERLNLDPAHQWPEPSIIIEPQPDDGPVTVMLDYRIDPATESQFVRVMNQLKEIRYRDGAISWTLSRDLANTSRYVEIFVVASWVEHERQHDRMTVDDTNIKKKVNSFTIKETSPAVTHLVYAHPTD